MFVRRPTRLLAAVALAAGLLLAPAGVGDQPAAAKPHNPTNQQIDKAKKSKAAKAAEVGRLRGLVARANGEMSRLSHEAELAGELYHKAEADHQRAVDRAKRARDAVDAAHNKVADARTSVGEFARASYMQGSTIGSGFALLDSNGPTELIERAGMLQSAAAHHLATVDKYEVANVAVANAESEARAAEADAEEARQKAAEARRIAQDKVADARERLAELRQERLELKGQLVKAQAKLDGLVSARKAYIKWKKEQERKARERAARLARQRAEAERRAAAAAEARAAAAMSASWSAERGQAAVNEAMQWLGTPYAWGGGGPAGPSYGIPPDAGVLGFDCSGLTMRSWSQAGLLIEKYSGYQYGAGSVHPSMSDLMPGDLLFWSTNGGPSGIHHVAMYVGPGQMIEAPQSGDVVKVTAIRYDGFIGATRPGT